MTFTWNRSAGAVKPQSVDPGALDPVDDEQHKKVGDLIVGFYDYLKGNAESHPELAPAIPELRLAIATYRSGQGDPAAALKNVLAAVRSARAQNSQIP